ncbi:hypothetical protein NCLIV_036110 [Neospora caninum Liverpool]|uniref:Uncharacterized protein n=1 Tax=Neospora caninum (strain Liverpool) TaxID=572307 RepID=F0VJB9_NEOCL|nr:hypothetical protein NCLIV_036110 [Neospora caninum Liverpool]CBZ53830.1 hypothetical protein NCLIV_036110 [Neospora caninum Liverpool]CEL67824.1 TPA: hypothetical protein BN1204_036110 [Neospora caninum Liverpool]|eukprot:XP_003883862.1 hypothetical protein NCLIV_036110 [Neospora caninum Liverpool]
MPLTFQWKATLWGYVDQLRSTVYFLRIQKFSNPIQSRCAAEEAARALMSFKEYARHEYDDLARMEVSLETELEGDERKADCWIEKQMYGASKGQTDGKRISITQTALVVSGSTADPRLAEQRYRESLTALKTTLGALELEMMKGGGPSGGWDATDHQAFERILHNAGGQIGRKGLVIRVKRALPHISKDSIDAHLVWYNEYTELATRKQELMKKYRDLKSAYAVEKAQQRETDAVESQRIKKEAEGQRKLRAVPIFNSGGCAVVFFPMTEEEATKQREMDEERQAEIQRKERRRLRRKQLLEELRKKKERELHSAKSEVCRRAGNFPMNPTLTIRCVSCRKHARIVGGRLSHRSSWPVLQRETTGETETGNMFLR